MAFTQMQLIQSLGEAMAWFEKEINWGVPATELRHLCGRLGELYVALITNGQMANEVNQKGYDVVSSAGERISVKTTAMSGTSGHVSFNPNSLGYVNRVVILRINTEEMQIETLMDLPVAEAQDFMLTDGSGKKYIPLGKLVTKVPKVTDLETVRTGEYGGYVIRELESGTMEVLKNGVGVVPVKPILKDLALRLNISLLNANGNPHNTRQLGSLVLKSINELSSTRDITEGPVAVEPE